MAQTKGRIYVAGPMRGYDLYNFPAFDDAAKQLRDQGWEVISPAEIDRELGLDPAKPLPEWFTIEGAMQRDLHEITHPLTTAIALLPGWERSEGSIKEVRTAMATGLDVYYFSDTVQGYIYEVAYDQVDARIGKASGAVTVAADRDPLTVLEEANNLIYGARNSDYGHPLDDFARTGRMWAAILGVGSVTAEQVGLCMVAVKVSRECNKHKRDNLTDIAGYAGTVDMVVSERERRAS